MQRIPGLLTLVFAIALTHTGEAAQKKEGKKPDGGEATAREYELLAKENAVVGKIVKAGGDRSLTLRIEYQTIEANPNPGLKGKPQGGGQRPPKNQGNRNPLRQIQELQRQMVQLQREQLQALKGQSRVVTKYRDFDLKTTADAQVRYQDLPTEFDDKGYPKKYTPAELKALKGSNPNLPGYAADFEKLQPGDLVRVQFSKKTKDKDEDEDGAPVSLIVILKVGADSALAQPDRKGKKKG